MDLLKSAVEFVFSPLGLISLILLGSAILTVRERYSLAGRRLLLVGTALFLLVTFSPLAEILIASLENEYPPLQAPPASVSAKRIVVLSSYGEANPVIPVTSSLSEDTICRLSEGIRLYRLTHGAKFLLSGGIVGQNKISLAAIMAEYLRQLGVPGQDILTEDRSLNTYENLLGVKEMIGAEPFILVTSACHLRRAMAVACKLGMNPTAAPACIWSLQHFAPGISWGEWFWKLLDSFRRPSPERWHYLRLACHEYAGYLWYRLRGQA